MRRVARELTYKRLSDVKNPAEKLSCGALHDQARIRPLLSDRFSLPAQEGRPRFTRALSPASLASTESTELQLLQCFSSSISTRPRAT